MLLDQMSWHICFVPIWNNMELLSSGQPIHLAIFNIIIPFQVILSVKVCMINCSEAHSLALTSIPTPASAVLE